MRSVIDQEEEGSLPFSANPSQTEVILTMGRCLRFSRFMRLSLLPENIYTPQGYGGGNGEKDFHSRSRGMTCARKQPGGDGVLMLCYFPKGRFVAITGSAARYNRVGERGEAHDGCQSGPGFLGR